MTDPQSPGGDDRFQLYAGEILPLGVFGGNLTYVGEDSVLTEYTAFYEQQSGLDTPWLMDLYFGFTSDNNYKITAEVQLEESVDPDSIMILIALTRHDESNYNSLVLQSSFDDHILITDEGQSLTIEKIFPNDEYQELTSLRAVAVIQNINTREILQSAQVSITQLIPELQVNIYSGPASLGVYFESVSFPVDNIVMWRWDFENDGIVDSEEESPYWVYNEPGIYDVKLMISDGISRTEKLFPELITVEETDQVEGTVLGVWRPQFNPYIIVNDISIPYYGELIIEPGTEIIVNYNKKINVYGRIDIAGSEEFPVILTSDAIWKGIKLLNTPEANRIEYAEISNSNLSALNASYSTIEILHSIFYNNTSGSLGSAINLLGCEDVLIAGNMIVNNSSSMTGGIALRASHPLIINNIIANNQGSMAGGIVIREGSHPLIINNVIVNNDAPIAAIFVNESTPEFINNILLDEEAVFLGNPDDMLLSYNLSSELLPGEGNIAGDPLFIASTLASGIEYNALTADWHLQQNSPAIDAGDPSPEFNDLEDPQNPGYAYYPALGTIRNDIGFYGGPGVLPEIVPADDDHITPANTINIIAYPNPFVRQDQRSQINFMIEGANGGELAIYNLRGQKIKEFILPDQAVSVSWDGRNERGNKVSTGIYFTRWQNTSQSASQKILILE